MKAFGLITLFILSLLVMTTEATTGQEVVDYAKQFLGISYVFGGNTPEEGFDCSGLTKYVYAHFGYDIPRLAEDQAYTGNAVSRENVQLGDLVCYSGHVSIYVGDGQVIHAPQPGEVVKISIIDMMPIIAIRRVLGSSGTNPVNPVNPDPIVTTTKKWLPEVTGYSTMDASNGYAGIMGYSVTGLRVSGGKPYRVHILGGDWLSSVDGNDQGNYDNGYAGTLKGSVIDAIAVSGGVKYAAHIKGGQWLPAVDGYDISEPSNGYAGVIGRPIDAIMIDGRTYATSYNV